MTPFCGIEINLCLKTWYFGVGLQFGEFPTMISLFLGPISIDINKPQYFKNGIIKFSKD